MTIRKQQNNIGKEKEIVCSINLGREDENMRVEDKEKDMKV